MRKDLLFVLCLSLGQVHAQSASQKSESLPLLSVGTNQLTTDEFVYLYRKNHQKEGDYTEKMVKEYLDLLVNFKLKVTEAETRGLDTTQAFRKEFKSYRQELMKPYLTTKDLLDSLTREAYKRMGVEVKAEHILVSMKPDATPADTVAAFDKIQAIRRRIIGGEDFGGIAMEVSDDPGAKSNRGSLGYFTALQMVYPFEQAAYRLNTGQISNPVRTRFGYHLIKVTDRRLARGEIEVSHIILRAGSADDKKVRNKIFEIYDQLQGGQSWDELCKEFSDDQATKTNGGRLRPFGVGAMAAVPEFESKAFSLHEPGEISDPFQSAYGWHIIRLERRIPIPPYEELEASLKKRVSRDERVQLAEGRALVEKKKTLGFSENGEIVKQLLGTADSSLLKGMWKFTGDPGLRARIVCSMRGQEIPASEFISYVEREQAPFGQTPSTYMAQLYEAFVKDQLEEKQESMLIETNPEYKNLIKEYREGILLFTIMEQEVWNKASYDTTGIRKFYEANREKFNVGERVHAYIFSTEDSVFLENMRVKVAAGDTIGQPEFKKFKSVVAVRNYSRGESKAIDNVPWSIGLYVTKIEGTFYMVQIDKLVPPGTKTLDEAKALVISDFQDFLEKQWVADLKSKYTVKLNKKGMKAIVRELTNK